MRRKYIWKGESGWSPGLGAVQHGQTVELNADADVSGYGARLEPVVDAAIPAGDEPKPLRKVR